MSPNRRIFLNVVATYGRSLYVTAIGIFSVRWVLRSLGHVDYGLVGVVGGLTGFVSFFNALMASAVGRYLAVNIGAANKNENRAEGVETCRKWFNTALLIHLVLASVLVAIGYPIGEWAVRDFLRIPVEKIEDCVWVWRYSCVACFVSMVCVPFQAMFTAKQEIAEMTIYSVLATTFNALFLYYMVTHPGEWLTKYSAWNSFILAAPMAVVAMRAVVKYQECRFCKRYLWDFNRVKELFVFSMAKFLVGLCGMIGSQGQALLVNKFMGPIYNSSMSIGNGVANHANTFAAALSTAFWPAIANKAGEGDVHSLKQLSFQACRFGSILIMVFAIPLALEIKYVLGLWLGNPPPCADWICLVVLLRFVLEKVTEGYEMAIYAVGDNVIQYCWIFGWAGVFTVGVAWICFGLGFGMLSIVIGLIVSKIITCIGRLWCGSRYPGFSCREWFTNVFIRIFIVGSLTMFVGFVVREHVGMSFSRLAMVTLVCEMIFLPLSWRCILSCQERQYVACRALAALRKFKGV